MTLPAEKQTLIRLVSGEVIQFSYKESIGYTILLSECRILFPPQLAYAVFPNGMEVHKAHIAWEAQGGLFSGY